MNSKIIIFLFIFLLTAPTLIFAHGNGHGEKNDSVPQLEETHSLNDSIYAVDGEKEVEPFNLGDDPLRSSLSNTDILGGENPLTALGLGDGEPMIRFEKKIDPKQKHSQHEDQKQHVEKTTHKLVSPRAKGYGVAVVITVISGLIFAGLSFFRIGEGNDKKPS